MQNSATVKWAESWMSFMVFFIDFLGDKFQVIVESEDAADEQEGLCHIDQQTIADIVNHHDLISHEGDAAHDEQHRTGILRDFKARVFHSITRVWHRLQRRAED